MRRLLDTSTCVALLRAKPERVTERFLDADSRDLLLCSTVAAELLFGALRSAKPEIETTKVQAFLGRLPIVGFGLPEAQAYAEIRHRLERLGAKIGANDLIIAATAIANRLILVTHDSGEFSRVAGLQIEDWHTEG